MLRPSTRLRKSYHLSSSAPMLLPTHRPAEFGWGRFCHAEQLQDWTLAREIILVGSQQEQILRAGFLQPQTHNDTKLLPRLCSACAVALWEPCPSIPPASAVSAPCPHTRAVWSARTAEAGRHEHQNKAALVQFQARSLREYPFNKDFEAFGFLFRLFAFAGSSKKINFVFCWYLTFSHIPTICQEGSLSLPNNNKILVCCSTLLYIFFSSRTSVLCILLHSPLTLFFSAAPCFYVSQEGLILYSCVLLARSLTCANY